MKSRRISLLVVSLVSLVGVPGLLDVTAHDAQAQGAAKPKPKAGGKAAAASEPQAMLPPDVLPRLKSGDEAQIRSGLDDVRMVGKGAESVVPTLVDLLKKGLTLPLTEATLDTLGDVGAEGASEVVSWYARHHTPTVRRAAVKALGHTKGPLAVKALRRALSDGDAAVRGSAASALGALKAREAVGDLFVALDHRVAEAAAAIGQLCKEDECEKLTAKLGALPFDVMTSGLDQMLFRPTTEVSDDLKVKIVGRVRELGTPDANKFLRDVQKRAAGWSPRLKQSVDQGVQATGGGGQ